jgi:hypothetical protein
MKANYPAQPTRQAAATPLAPLQRSEGEAPFVDQRLAAVAQRQRSQLAAFSPRAQAHAATADRIHAGPAMAAQRRQMAATAPVQLRLIPDAVVDGSYRVEGESADEGPYTLIAGSDLTHRIVGITIGGRRMYYDNQTGHYASAARHQAYMTILAAYGNDLLFASDMYDMSEQFTEADAKAMIPWLATQSNPLRRFVYQNRATLNIPHANRVAITWFRFQAMFPTAAAAAAILSTAKINYESGALRRMLETGKFATLAELTTVAAWANFTNAANMEQIVTHAKLDTAARLVAWLALPGVDTGARLYSVLQNPKITTGAELSTRLQRYSLVQIGQWLGKAWVRQDPAGLTAINGKVPLATANANGEGGTAGQRYTPFQGSGASIGLDYHLSMSFSVENAASASPKANYTGLHVTYRRADGVVRSTDPRVFYRVAAGEVEFANTAGAFPAADRAGMRAEADAMIQRNLVNLNCYW